MFILRAPPRPICAAQSSRCEHFASMSRPLVSISLLAESHREKNCGRRSESGCLLFPPLKSPFFGTPRRKTTARFRSRASDNGGEAHILKGCCVSRIASSVSKQFRSDLASVVLPSHSQNHQTFPHGHVEDQSSMLQRPTAESLPRILCPNKRRAQCFDERRRPAEGEIPPLQ